jgi:MHS family proline/betaine transporter-like MFS transporter
VLFRSVQPAYMVNMVPAHVRCSATGLAYNLTLGIAGGLSPMAATWLVHRTHDDLSPAFLVIVAALISLIALLTDRRPANASSPGAVGRQPASHPL